MSKNALTINDSDIPTRLLAAVDRLRTYQHGVIYFSRGTVESPGLPGDRVFRTNVLALSEEWNEELKGICGTPWTDYTRNIFCTYFKRFTLFFTQPLHLIV